MKIKAQNQYQQIILDSFIKQKNFFANSGNNWISMSIESLESLLLFSDKYWTPKFKLIDNEKSAKKFINTWFFVNKKSFDSFCSKNNYKDKDETIKKIEDAKNHVFSQINTALLKIKNNKKNIKTK